MSGDAGEYGRVMAAEEVRDLGEAVATLGMVAHAPPGLLPCERDAARTRGAAELIETDAATRSDLLDEIEQVAEAELLDDGVHGAHQPCLVAPPDFALVLRPATAAARSSATCWR